MTDILPTVNRTLKLPKSKDPNKPVMPSSSKQWTRIRGDVKTYITDIIQVGKFEYINIYDISFERLSVCQLLLGFMLILYTLSYINMIYTTESNEVTLLPPVSAIEVIELVPSMFLSVCYSALSRLYHATYGLKNFGFGCTLTTSQMSSMVKVVGQSSRSAGWKMDVLGMFFLT